VVVVVVHRLDVFSVLVKRLAGKSISKMSFVVLSEM